MKAVDGGGGEKKRGGGGRRRRRQKIVRTSSLNSTQLNGFEELLLLVLYDNDGFLLRYACTIVLQLSFLSRAGTCDFSSPDAQVALYDICSELASLEPNGTTASGEVLPLLRQESGLGGLEVNCWLLEFKIWYVCLPSCASLLLSP